MKKVGRPQGYAPTIKKFPEILQNIMNKNCKNCSQPFEITQKDRNFYEKISPVFSGKRYLIPEPTLCPDCRQQRRLSWQNMKNLYMRKCPVTGKNILSNYEKNTNVTVFDQAFWWSDAHDFRNFGQDFDFSKSFFENFSELMYSAPIPNLFTNYTNDENSEYTNYAGFDKNCYLLFHADMNRDCMFGTGVKKCVDSLDLLNVFESELCYQCVDCKNCYSLKFSTDCQNCSSSAYLKNCIGCKNCFGCINLTQKEYFLFNKFVGKEKFEAFIQDFKAGKNSVVSELQKRFFAFQKTQIHPAVHGFQNENCSGDHIFHSQNCEECFDVQDSRDMKFCERIYNGPNADCYDVDQFGMKIEQILESGPIGDRSQMSAFVMLAYGVVDVCYSEYAFNSKNCFGCFGIKNAEYCILNKQYTKDEYEKLVPQIIEHMQSPSTSSGTSEWGEFFPVEISPFAYNETVAQEYFPLTPEEISGKNWKWKEKDMSHYQPQTCKIPDDISDAPENICSEILACETCQKNYKIQKQELKFYKNQNIPIPKKCPDCRHLERVKLRNPRKLFTRNCDKCSVKISTTYASERPEQVFCEECYRNEVL